MRIESSTLNKKGDGFNAPWMLLWNPCLRNRMRKRTSERSVKNCSLIAVLVSVEKFYENIDYHVPISSLVVPPVPSILFNLKFLTLAKSSDRLIKRLIIKKPKQIFICVKQSFNIATVA